MAALQADQGADSSQSLRVTLTPPCPPDHRSPFTAAMFCLLLALCVLAGSISAEHYTCTWQPGKEVPTTYSFKHYCAATIASREDQDKVGFACVAGGVGKESTEVGAPRRSSRSSTIAEPLLTSQGADWGYFHPNLLEVCEWARVPQA